MLNYDEELKKFKHCLSVDEVENAIYEKEFTDIIDLLREMKDSKERNVKGADK